MLSGAVCHFDARAFEASGRHLACHRTFENQFVEPRVIARTRPLLAEVGGADGFMRFLGILGLGSILPWFIGDIRSIITFGDSPTRGRNCAAVHLDTVGAHVCDRAVFVETLCQPHGVARRKAKLARRFLLQGRGRERRRRIARQRLCFDVLNSEMPALYRDLRSHRIAFVADGQAVDLVTFPSHEPCDK